MLAQGAAGTRSGLSLPPSFPLVKEISAQRRLPKPCAQQAHGAAQQSKGTKGQRFPRLPLIQELALGWLGWLWHGSQTPRQFLILGEAEQWSGGRLESREHSQPWANTTAWAVNYPQLEVWLTYVRGVYLEPSHGLRAAVYLGDKSP